MFRTSSTLIYAKPKKIRGFSWKYTYKYVFILPSGYAILYVEISGTVQQNLKMETINRSLEKYAMCVMWKELGGLYG